MTRRFDPDRTLRLGSPDDFTRLELWFYLFYAMRDVARKRLADLGCMEISDWVERCHLERSEGNWVVKQARNTQRVWTDSDHLWQKLDPGITDFVGEMIYEPEPIALAWSPQSETLSAFRERARKALKDHEDGVLVARDWTQPKANRNLERDLRWLVRFQVLGNSWSKVAARHEAAVGVDAVRRAVRRLARQMGLTLRTE